jgi:hypothetical protein
MSLSAQAKDKHEKSHNIQKMVLGNKIEYIYDCPKSQLEFTCINRFGAQEKNACAEWGVKACGNKMVFTIMGGNFVQTYSSTFKTKVDSALSAASVSNQASKIASQQASAQASQAAMQASQAASNAAMQASQAATQASNAAMHH